MENAQAVIEDALVEAKAALAQAESERIGHLEFARAKAEHCDELRKAIAAYHKALGRKADGSERKVRGAGKAGTSDE
ncbi:MAG: hypothetical protein ABFE07_08355 [Armatimonadia bacterium]|jgi:hypothetical protein